jgi:hypothetical protein
MHLNGGLQRSTVITALLERQTNYLVHSAVEALTHGGKDFRHASYLRLSERVAQSSDVGRGSRAVPAQSVELATQLVGLRLHFGPLLSQCVRRQLTRLSLSTTRQRRAIIHSDTVCD